MMNPRYLAYCRAHGRTPDDMLAYDTERFPGGKMCGFMLWIQEQWRMFEVQHDVRAESRRQMRHFDRDMFRASNMDAFDVWLEDEYQ